MLDNERVNEVLTSMRILSVVCAYHCNDLHPRPLPGFVRCAASGGRFVAHI